MKITFLMWAGWVLIVLVAATHFSTFLDGCRIGLEVGLGVLVLVLYPAHLHNHEKRLAALEGPRGEGWTSAGQGHEDPSHP